MEQGPVLIITFQAQVVMVIKNQTGEVVEGDPVSDAHGLRAVSPGAPLVVSVGADPSGCSRSPGCPLRMICHLVGKPSVGSLFLSDS